ncbi:MAG: hypothetical protein IJN92_05950 [Lachnospiraceae bacterium]|nr:hypothetical protein [Lachnospiraceae bacterium]
MFKSKSEKISEQAVEIVLKENKRLKLENQKLRESLDKIGKLKNEYKELIENLNGIKKEYLEKLESFDKLENEYKKKLEREIKKNNR